jgi:4,5-dihydroxyphthalate decarboxylase
LVRAFQRAKEICYARNSDPRSFALVWVQDLLREQREIFGPDPWPYNLDDNRTALDAVIRYESEQGMIRKRPQPEELFFPPSLQTIQQYV